MSAPLKIVISGHGRMGVAVAEAARGRGHEVLGFVSRTTEGDWPTVHVALETYRADVVVDFTDAGALDAVVASCLLAKVPLVTGTTGWHERAKLVRKLVDSGKGTMLHAANFSLGVQLFARTVSRAAELFGALEGFDVGVEERHHRRKADAPSGTALMLARRIVDAWPGKDAIVAGNAQRVLEPEDVSVSSLRTGTEFGRHVVVVDGEHDLVEVSHVARSRRGFAAGAVHAAEWIVGKTGFFTIDDLIDDLVHRARPSRDEEGET